MSSASASRFGVLATALLLAACHQGGLVELTRDPVESQPLHAWASGLVNPNWREDEAAAIIEQARCGAPETQYQAGQILDRGLGMAPNAVGAYAWYAIAASRGFEPAAAERDRLAARLSTYELSEAGRIASTWPPSACRDQASQDSSG